MALKRNELENISKSIKFVCLANTNRNLRNIAVSHSKSFFSVFSCGRYSDLARWRLTVVCSCINTHRNFSILSVTSAWNFACNIASGMPTGTFLMYSVRLASESLKDSGLLSTHEMCKKQWGKTQATDTMASEIWKIPFRRRGVEEEEEGGVPKFKLRELHRKPCMPIMDMYLIEAHGKHLHLVPESCTLVTKPPKTLLWKCGDVYTPKATNLI